VLHVRKRPARRPWRTNNRRMMLDADAAYLALKSRDARFDGRLFVGVTSTGIYCRPICRVRLPRRENCRFFETAAQAEAEAFRPCLKCRPEIAPGPGLAWSVTDASRTLARQAAGWLDAQAGAGPVPRLSVIAMRLGVSDRHLRRIFQAEHGVTPVQYLQTRRLLTAKQLLTDTRLPVSQVALASGFGSLRRFNSAFVHSYRMSPSRLRDQVVGDRLLADDAVSVTLAYRAPYDTHGLLRFLAQRAIPGIEQVEGLRIRRTVRAGLAGAPEGWVQAEFAPERSQVRLRYAVSLAPATTALLAATRRWLDLDAMPQAIDAALQPLGGPPGLRLPGSIDAFELAVRAILGQQVSIAAARTLATRLVERYGSPVATPWPAVERAFPSPQVLTAAGASEIASLGIVGTRAQAIAALAGAWPGIELHLLPHRTPEGLVAALCELPGIGPWTAHYIAMRALGWPDAFLPHDVALHKAMRVRYGCDSSREAEAIAQAWRPWRSYAVLRLWNSLENAS
jgi:AraC family transcriptional regulator, regulatory protein of adaptative response / DNA-3-methyladenine glycosylase II